MTDYTTLPIPAVKVSALPAATLPLEGDEGVTIIQDGVTCRAPASAFGSDGGGVDLSGEPYFNLSSTVNGVTVTFQAWVVSPTALNVFFSLTGTCDTSGLNTLIAEIPVEINSAIAPIYLQQWELGSGQTALLIWSNNGDGNSRVLFQLNAPPSVHTFASLTKFGCLAAVVPASVGGPA